MGAEGAEGDFSSGNNLLKFVDFPQVKKAVKAKVVGMKIQIRNIQGKYQRLSKMQYL